MGRNYSIPYNIIDCVRNNTILFALLFLIANLYSLAIKWITLSVYHFNSGVITALINFPVRKMAGSFRFL